MNQQQLDFIEDIGMAFERLGTTPMLGRVLGALMVAESNELSAEDLSTILQASRGSISHATRQLVVMSIIQRVRKPGVRRDYFRVLPNAWAQATRHKGAEIDLLTSLFQRGLDTMTDAPPEARQSIEETLAFLHFWKSQFNKFLIEWDELKRQST